MTTPHIDAEPGQIAATVLFPGDPLRARHIAQEYLDDVVEVNARRNMLAYTGRWHGMPLSVMGSGMGIPSLAIYATELARHFGVRRLIRVGTCGGLGAVALGDLLLAATASTDSAFNRQAFGGHDLSAGADFGLLRAVAGHAERQGIAHRVAPVFSTDAFYDGDPALLPLLRRHRIAGIEMESAGLYGLAMRECFAALSVLTVSDHLERNERMSAQEREQGLSRMVELVLGSLSELDAAEARAAV